MQVHSHSKYSVNSFLKSINEGRKELRKVLILKAQESLPKQFLNSKRQNWETLF